jgi:hypothetical protein
MGTHARQTKAGINIATSGSWGTGAASATALGAGDGHYVRDDLGLVLRMQQARDDSASQDFIGSVQSANADEVAVTVPVYMHYKDAWMNVLYALALGTGGTSPVQIGATTAYSNTFEPSTSKTGLYATVVQDKVEDIFEVPGAKCTGFTLTAGEMGRMEAVFNFIGDLVKEDSTVNTATQISALTFPTQGLRTFLDDAQIRINAQGGAALSAGDAIDVTSLTISFSQPLDTRHVAGQTTIIEPCENEFPDFTVELEAGRSGTTWNAFFAGHRNTTAYKMEVEFTGATLATTNYGVLFQFPNGILEPYEAPVPGGAGQIIPRMTFRALSTTAAPTGMTGVTVPMRVTTTGESTGNPFA